MLLFALVGGVVIACREEDLHEAAGDRTRKRGGALAKRPDLPGREAPLALSVSQAERRRLASLDLHGATVEEALRRVEDHVDRALRAGLDSIDLIHGRGSGRIKAAVHRLLAELSAVRRFEVTPANPGVTRVFF